MALIVEDGTIVAGAESYLSVADADTYWSNRNVPNWDGSAANKEAALRIATQFIDATYEFESVLQDANQPLKWPRSGFLGKSGRSYDSNTIPQCIKDATAELAREWVLNGALVPNLDRGGDIKRVKAGSVEVEYMDKAMGGKSFAYISRLLNDVINGISQTANMRLERV